MNSDFDSSSDSNSDKGLSLSNIISDIGTYINSTPKFKSIATEVEIVELKVYPNVIFMKVREADGNSQIVIKTIIYKSNYKIKLDAGNKIKINAELKFYKNELELIIKSYVLVGQGIHTTALTKLKVDLARLGYFDNKKIIGQNYHTIGIVSSINAAGMKDFVHTINSRCSGKKIYLYPATMQGSNAPTEICTAIKLANRHNMVQILVIIRGGGSKDDLECFNDKSIAKTIHESNLPIVTGIGHQIDVSVADLVADQNFITPTATAQSITIENLLTVDKLRDQISNVKSIFKAKINAYYNYISNAEFKIQKYRDICLNNIGGVLHNHQSRKNEMKYRIQTVSNMRYNYLSEAENTLEIIKSNLTKTYTDAIIIHTHNLELVDTRINKTIYEFDDQLAILAKPTIIRTDTDEEVHTLKKFKLGSRYRIKFIDGYYDIKIRR